MADESYAGIVRRLSLLESERSISRTLSSYSRAADRGNVAAFVDCFTSDGAYECRGPVSYRLLGRTAIKGFFQEFTTNVDPSSQPFVIHHKHFVLSSTFFHDTEGEVVRCESYFLVTQDVEGVPQIRLFGRYLDRLIRESDDVWRFAERIIEIESMRSNMPRLVYSATENGVTDE